jgi:predicted trehalose synthase
MKDHQMIQIMALHLAAEELGFGLTDDVTRVPEAIRRLNQELAEIKDTARQHFEGMEHYREQMIVARALLKDAQREIKELKEGVAA